MRISKLIGKRFKERPVDAALESHVFLLRGGYIRQVANGIFSLLFPGVRIAKKVEQIVRGEMDLIGGQEVQMPIVLPRELWEESGRYDSVGLELLRVSDRNKHDYVLGMTHEEAVVHLCRDEISSYKQLPFMVYQVQTKFRDELRSRGGLIRVREFVMKDAYSFHASIDDLNAFYKLCWRAYERIFARVGIPEVVVVESDTGMMGGSVAHEFMLLCERGEDTVVTCNQCDYLANRDVATGRLKHFPEAPLSMVEVCTPEKKSIEQVAAFLDVPTLKVAKVVFYRGDQGGKLVLAMIRGDLEINETKLAKIIGAAPVLADHEEIVAIGAVPGFASPMGVSAKDCRFVIDETIRSSNNLVCGANKVDHHVRNFNLDRDLSGCETFDVAQVRDGDGCPLCEGQIVLRRGIEVGNIFQLGTKYSEPMNMKVLDEHGRGFAPIMGSYGIGIGRLLSAVLEVKHDEFGPIWPISIAPWQLHVIALNSNDKVVFAAAQELYEELRGAGVEVMMDDRNERAGVQFADADLLGVPFRIILSKRNVANGKVEFKRRGEKDSCLVDIGHSVTYAKQSILDAMRDIENRVPAPV